jgi:predicted AlkP superfamily phosphohydrolase/phosphomutase
MPAYSPVNIIAKVRKVTFGIVVGEGERVKAYIGGNGYARLVRNQNVTFKPDEYELYIPDEEYDKLLTSG